MAKEILVVDDEKDTRALLKAILEDAGYKVRTAFNGPDALKKLKKKLPALVLIDMFMPGMSGRELCEMIRVSEKLKKLKCVFLTVADFSVAGKKKLKELKVLDYIKKTSDNKGLVKRIKKIV